MKNGSSDIHVVRMWRVARTKENGEKEMETEIISPPPYPSSSRCFAPIGDLGDEVAEAL